MSAHQGRASLQAASLEPASRVNWARISLTFAKRLPISILFTWALAEKVSVKSECLPKFGADTLCFQRGYSIYCESDEDESGQYQKSLTNGIAPEPYSCSTRFLVVLGFTHLEISLISPLRFTTQ